MLGPLVLLRSFSTIESFIHLFIYLFVFCNFEVEVAGVCKLYNRPDEERKRYHVLCRWLASLNEEFISNKSSSAGFDFAPGKRIDGKLLD